jgi:hypothetical protein
MSLKIKPSFISRRDLFQTATTIAGGAAVIAASFAASPARADKMSQKGVDYQTTPKNGQQCDGCNLFKAPSSCTIVDGTISPTGWCRLFSKKS